MGADEPILYSQTDVVTTVLNWTNGEGVDVAFDTVGGQRFFETCQLVKVYGDIVTILQPDTSLDNLKVARNRNLRISLELMLTPSLMGLETAQSYQTEILEQGRNLFDEGKLKIHLSRTFPLEEANKGHEALETGLITGKTALIIQ